MLQQTGTISREVIAELVTRIVQAASPLRVILFGSAATGRADSNSDVDLLIVEERPFGPGRSRRAELTRLWMALADVPIAKDLLLYSEEEYQHWATSLNHVIAQAAREGTVVYERK